MPDKPSLNSDLPYSKDTSILLQLTNKSISNASMLALIGSFFWGSTITFYLVNDAMPEPLTEGLIFIFAPILNILATLFFLYFAHFLFKNQDNVLFRRYFLILFIGCIFNVIARVVDGINEFLFQTKAGNETLDIILFVTSDITHLIGTLAMTIFMFFLFTKERNTSYKVISMISFIFSLLWLTSYVFYLLLDFGVISIIYIQLTRLTSILASITFIIFFSMLLSASIKYRTTSSDRELNF